MNHKNSRYNYHTIAIAEISIMIALTLVLEIISRLIFSMPNGGTINMGYSIIFFYAFRRGFIKASIIVLFNSVLMVIFIFPPIGFGQFLLDYIIGFEVIPLTVACLGWTLKSQNINLKKIIFCVLIGMSLSFAVSTVSGVYYFIISGPIGSRFQASLIYNIIYVAPTSALTLVILIVVFRQKSLIEW